MSTQNDTAKAFKALHKPGNPLILSNIWDAITARTVAALPQTQALATASYAIAAAAGIQDEELTLETNLRAVSAIAKVANEFTLPLTVDFQDGFGDQLAEGVREVIRLGAVGINLEDLDRNTNALFSVEEAQTRIRRVMEVAKEEDVPDFVVNARTDALFTPASSSTSGGSLEEAIARGKAYLAAGASNIFIWGGPSRKGWGRDDVETATKALGGRLNVLLVMMQPGGLSVNDLSDIGVSRISIGPQLMFKVVSVLSDEAGAVLQR
ncbi:PEP phosphonomutase-like protein [Decorospora gaudefroyi]|uniref:PEP phosphonomutase-like protein n=1 Tax=Decorospora gaudefroyi TaxID=184978 RepID=A0A6A5KVS5_9PLEO|nr:PEP phosphonomutase-like protein [Decorospora gaudefroyi]